MTIPMIAVILGMTAKPQTKPVVIVGAGPAALLFAHRTLQHDPEARVQLFERSSRADLGLDGGQRASRSYGFALGPRGQKQLAQVDLLDPVAARGKRVASLIKNNQGKLVVSRNALCLTLLEALEERYPARVECRHGLALDEVDLEARTLTFTSTAAGMAEGMADGAEEARRCEVDGWQLLVGADGVHSAVRGALARQARGFRATVHRSKRVWQTLHLGSDTGLPADRNSFIDAGTWRTGAVGGVVVPQATGGFAALLSWRTDRTGSQGPWRVRDADGLRARMHAALPSLCAIDADELAAFVRAPPQHEHIVRCSRYHDAGAAVALLGDAAHGGYSMLGQGCSAALCGAACLQQQLAQAESVPAALEAYTQAQRPEGVALAELNLLAHVRYSRAGYFFPPLRRRLVARLMAILEGVNDPQLSYAQVARRHRGTVAVSKAAWRADRLGYAGRP